MSTAHNAKGLEWDGVIVYGADARSWKANDPELRRLFYVALTRARRRVTFFSVGAPSPLIAEARVPTRNH